jgi:hypothetical protein
MITGMISLQRTFQQIREQEILVMAIANLHGKVYFWKKEDTFVTNREEVFLLPLNHHGTHCDCVNHVI